MPSSKQKKLNIQEESSDQEVTSNDDEAANSDEPTEEEDNSDAGELVDSDEESDEAPTLQSEVPTAIDASSTESDDDEDEVDDDEDEVEDDEDEVDDDNDIPSTKAPKASKTHPKFKELVEKIVAKYEKRQGLQLYIRFPEKLPENEEEFQKKLKSLSELIVVGHKPRQKYARFCLVDFETTENRDLALKEIKKNSAETKFQASLPRTESEGFVENLVDKKLNYLEKKKARILHRRELKKAAGEKVFTSTLVVCNIPNTASKVEIKELFPDAVDMDVKPAPEKFKDTLIATITLPSTADATENAKRKLFLGENKLCIKFNNALKKKKKPKKKQNLRNAKKSAEVDTPIKGPLAPPSSNGKQPDPEKKNKNENKAKAKPKPKVKANGAKPVEVKEVTPKLPLSQKRIVDDDSEKKKSPKKAKLAADVSVESAQTDTTSEKKVAPSKPKPGQNAPKVKKDGKPQGKNPFPQKKGNAPPKGDGKKQHQPNKQKQKPPQKNASKAAAK